MQADAGEIPFIKVYNLSFTGILNLDYKPVFISRQIHESELSRSEVRAGDILINIVGPPLGQVSIVPPQIREGNINQAIARFRVIFEEYRKFLSFCLMTKSIMNWATKRAKTTAGQSNLTLELCRDLPIPLPPLAEQKRMVEEVERRLSVIDGMEATVSANLQRSTRLRQSILQKAFN
jgi:type I restriction enzyme S subunit